MVHDAIAWADANPSFVWKIVTRKKVSGRFSMREKCKVKCCRGRLAKMTEAQASKSKRNCVEQCNILIDSPFTQRRDCLIEFDANWMQFNCVWAHKFSRKWHCSWERERESVVSVLVWATGAVCLSETPRQTIKLCRKSNYHDTNARRLRAVFEVQFAATHRLPRLRCAVVEHNFDYVIKISRPM